MVAPLAPATAQNLDPSVAFVVTGGSWTDSTFGGRYRVIVRTGGFEHVTSVLTIEWVREAATPGDTALVHARVTVDSITPGVWSLGAPTLSCADRRCQIHISGSNAYEPADRTWAITIGTPGHYLIERRK